MFFDAFFYFCRTFFCRQYTNIFSFSMNINVRYTLHTFSFNISVVVITFVISFASYHYFFLKCLYLSWNMTLVNKVRENSWQTYYTQTLLLFPFWLTDGSLNRNWKKTASCVVYRYSIHIIKKLSKNDWAKMIYGTVM